MDSAVLEEIKSLEAIDEVGVISYSMNKGLTIHEYFTSDHQKVRDVVQGFGIKEVLGRAQKIEDRYWEERKDEWTAGRMGLAKKHKKGLYKGQVLNISQELNKLAKALRYVPGAKHIIFFSGGIANSILYGISPSPSGISIDRVRSGDALLRGQYENMSKELAASNSSVYAVNTEGLTSHFGDRDMMGDHSLKQLADLSGGKYFGNIDSYEEIMDEIQSITSAYYVLGYYIDEKWDGKYRNIKVKVKKKGCRVYGQEGYFNPKPFTEYTEFEKLLHLIGLALSEKPHFQEPLHFPLTTLPYSIQEKSNLLLLTKIPAEKIKEILGKKMEIVTLIFDKQSNVVELIKDEKQSKSTDLLDIYPFDPNQYSPLVEELNQGISKLLALMRYSIIDIQEPEFHLSACLIHLSSGQKIPLSFSILSTKKEEEISTLLTEFQIPELESGKYSFNLIAEELKTKSTSQISSRIQVR